MNYKYPIELFDGHVHIIPSSMSNAYDERFKIQRINDGCIKTSTGYVMQLLPPYFRDSVFSSESLIKTMDFYGVKKAAIMQSLCFEMNAEVAAAVLQHEERLVGAMVIEPKDGAIEEIRYWRKRGLSIIKFEMSEGIGFSSPKAFPDMRFNDIQMKEIFAEAEKNDITIAIDPSRIEGSGYQIEEVEEVLKSFPLLHVVICHLGVPDGKMTKKSAQQIRWKQMLSLARYKNVWFDISALPAIFKESCYPYKEAIVEVSDFINCFGPEKVIWGSDIPGTFLQATYKQMIDMFMESKCFSLKDKEMMFKKNAENAYRF